MNFRKYLLLLTTLLVTVTVTSQTKATGLVTLGGSLKVKIEKNFSNSTVTITLVGPSDRWFSVGFNAFGAMTSGTDCVYYATSLVDAKINGQASPATDGINNWTTVSNTVVSGIRTVVATRPFATGDSNDYTFDYAANSMNVIWAYAPSATTNIGSQHSSGTRGSAALSFSVLDIEQFNSLQSLLISPNPSSGVFTLYNDSKLALSKISIFDTNAKLIKELLYDASFQEYLLDLSELPKGIYFLELSNETDKEVRKIGIN